MKGLVGIIGAGIIRLNAVSQGTLDAKISNSSLETTGYFQTPPEVVASRLQAYMLTVLGESSLEAGKYYNASKQLGEAVPIFKKTKDPGGDFEYFYSSFLLGKLCYDLSTSENLDPNLKSKLLKESIEHLKVSHAEYKDYIQRSHIKLDEDFKKWYLVNLDANFTNVYASLGRYEEAAESVLRLIERLPIEKNVEALIKIASKYPDGKFDELILMIHISLGNKSEPIIRRILNLREENHQNKN